MYLYLYLYLFLFLKKNVIMANIQNVTHVKVNHFIKVKLQSLCTSALKIQLIILVKEMEISCIILWLRHIILLTQNSILFSKKIVRMKLKVSEIMKF